MLTVVTASAIPMHLATLSGLMLILRATIEPSSPKFRLIFFIIPLLIQLRKL